MKTFILHYYISGSLFLLLFLMISCKDFKLQTSASYDGKPIDPHINMNAWEFISSRSDFSVFKNLIDSAGMRSYYQQTDKKYTYLFVKNDKMNNYLSKYSDKTITTMPMDKRILFIKYHIIDGEYSALKNEIPTNYILVHSLIEGEGGQITIKMYKASSLYYVDYYTGNMVMVAGSVIVNPYSTNGTSYQQVAITSNLEATNGIIHVLEDYVFYQNEQTGFKPLY